MKMKQKFSFCVLALLALNCQGGVVCVCVGSSQKILWLEKRGETWLKLTEDNQTFKSNSVTLVSSSFFPGYEVYLNQFIYDHVKTESGWRFINREAYSVWMPPRIWMRFMGLIPTTNQMEIRDRLNLEMLGDRLALETNGIRSGLISQSGLGPLFVATEFVERNGRFMRKYAGSAKYELDNRGGPVAIKDFIQCIAPSGIKFKFPVEAEKNEITRVTLRVGKAKKYAKQAGAIPGNGKFLWFNIIEPSMAQIPTTPTN